MKEKQGLIYLLRNKVNNKGYVGQHCTPNEEKRWRAHIYDALIWMSEHPVHRAIRKYKVEGFTAEVVWRGPISKLNAMETRYIKEFNTFAHGGHGYNLTRGGGGVRGLAAWNKGIAMTDEQRAKLRKALFGRPGHTAWNKDKRLSAAHRKAIKDGLANSTKSTHPPGWSEKVSAKLKGRIFTPEWLARISASLQGRKVWNKGLKGAQVGWSKGKKATPEALASMRAGQARRRAREREDRLIAYERAFK